MNFNEIVNYVVKKYYNDRKEYLNTGIWPKSFFDNDEFVWIYYNYLKITDYSINLNKYLDFDYANLFSRDRLVELMNKYGQNILVDLYIYYSSDLSLSFEEWYNNNYNTKTIRK